MLLEHKFTKNEKIIEKKKKNNIVQLRLHNKTPDVSYASIMTQMKSNCLIMTKTQYHRSLHMQCLIFSAMYYITSGTRTYIYKKRKKRKRKKLQVL